MKNYFQILLLTFFLLGPELALAEHEHEDFLELDKDGIKIHFFSHEHFGFGTFNLKSSVKPAKTLNPA